jgi:hypothetical protein
MIGKPLLYDIGDLATVDIRITDANDVPGDPSDLTVKLMEPDGTVTSFTPSSPLLTHPAVGHFVFTLPKAFDASGYWRVRAEATGNLVQAQETRMRVRGSRFVNA